MSKETNTYQRIIAYLKGLLSDRQRHDLEKEIMHDVFEEEAFEGLTQWNADELTTDMEVLNNRLENRLKPAKGRFLGTYLRVAAAITLIIGVGGLLYMLLRQTLPVGIAELPSQKAAPVPAAAAKADTMLLNANKPIDLIAPEPSKKQMLQPPSSSVPIPEKSRAKSASSEVVSDTFIDGVVDSQEDILALEEVVVVGYGTQRRNDVTGAVSRLESKDLTPVREAEAVNFINPVPPGGSLKAFKSWVDDKLDRSMFNDLKGKYRVQVTFTVDPDGSIHDVQVKNAVPAAIADAYKNIVTQSPSWQPATKDGIPVEARVVIRFTLTLE